MATDMGSLALKHSEHIIGFGISFWAHSLFKVDCLAIAQLNIATRLRISLWPPPLIPFAPPVYSPFLQSVAHYTSPKYSSTIVSSSQ
jgi:hypothetical protein